MAERAKTTDLGIEIFLGRLLRTGVVIAAILVFTGGVWFLAQAGGARKDYKVFRGEPAELNHAAQIVHGAIQWQPLAVIQFGLLVLIATPVARVVFSMLGFGIERDWMYVGITALVLAVLLYSLIDPAAR